MHKSYRGENGNTYSDIVYLFSLCLSAGDFFSGGEIEKWQTQKSSSVKRSMWLR